MKNGNQLSDIIFGLYQDVSKEHKVSVDRIMFAITDDGNYFQAYATDEKETNLSYLCDVRISNIKNHINGRDAKGE